MNWGWCWLGVVLAMIVATMLEHHIGSVLHSPAMRSAKNTMRHWFVKQLRRLRLAR